MGNILTLKRGPANADTIKSWHNGNQLSYVCGALNGNYNGNGNMIFDGIRNATLTYNRHNLPVSVSKGDQTASYVYDASGLKLRSVQGSDTREYINGIQYTNNSLDFVATEEGRAVRNPSTGVYKYEYNLKDHLGNVRVTLTSSMIQRG